MADQARGVAYPLFERVNAVRAEKGWTWTRLHEKSGVARSTIGNWQKIQAAPQPETVNAVADALGIPRLEALHLAGVVTGRIPDDAPVCSLEREILDLGGEVSAETKALIINRHRKIDPGHQTCRPLAEGITGRKLAGLQG